MVTAEAACDFDKTQKSCLCDFNFFFFLLSQKLAEAWEMKSVRLRGGGLDRLRKASFKKKKGK